MPAPTKTISANRYRFCPVIGGQRIHDEIDEIEVEEVIITVCLACNERVDEVTA